MKKELTPEQKEKRKEYQKKYNEANRERIKETCKLYSKKNKDKLVAYNKLHKEQTQLAKKTYRDKNKETIKEYNKIYTKNRKLVDPLYRLKISLRSSFSVFLNGKGFKKETKTEQILGCSFEQFKLHLETNFEPWMNWGNRGNPKDGVYIVNKTWDIDHIIPLDTAKTYDEIIKLCHYTNLRPLCSFNNRWVKGKTI